MKYTIFLIIVLTSCSNPTSKPAAKQPGMPDPPRAKVELQYPDYNNTCPHYPSGDSEDIDCDMISKNARVWDNSPSFIVDMGPDNCTLVYNPGQENTDGDVIHVYADSKEVISGIPTGNYINYVVNISGDACDPCPLDPQNDIDSDGLCSDEDNCPAVYNPGQENEDEDEFGDICDEYPVGNYPAIFPNVNCNDMPDADELTCQGQLVSLGVLSCSALVPEVPCGHYVDTTVGANTAAVCNASLATLLDLDNDGLGNSCDNCDSVANPDQRDDDNDGTGNACE
jgi:hypothetical protein